VIEVLDVFEVLWRVWLDRLGLSGRHHGDKPVRTEFVVE
jgi:hypothetical protein